VKGSWRMNEKGGRHVRADLDKEEETGAGGAGRLQKEERDKLKEAGVKVPEGNIGKKKLEKLQAKADKKLAREAEEREREEATVSRREGGGGFEKADGGGR